MRQRLRELLVREASPATARASPGSFGRHPTRRHAAPRLSVARGFDATDPARRRSALVALAVVPNGNFQAENLSPFERGDDGLGGGRDDLDE